MTSSDLAVIHINISTKRKSPDFRKVVRTLSDQNQDLLFPLRKHAPWWATSSHGVPSKHGGCNDHRVGAVRPWNTSWTHTPALIPKKRTTKLLTWRNTIQTTKLLRWLGISLTFRLPCVLQYSLIFASPAFPRYVPTGGGVSLLLFTPFSSLLAHLAYSQLCLLPTFSLNALGSATVSADVNSSSFKTPGGNLDTIILKIFSWLCFHPFHPSQAFFHLSPQTSLFLFVVSIPVLLHRLDNRHQLSVFCWLHVPVSQQRQNQISHGRYETRGATFPSEV